MAKTLRKKIEHWTIEWEKLHAKGEQKESLELYIAKHAIEEERLKIASYLDSELTPETKDSNIFLIELRKQILSGKYKGLYL